MADVTLAEEGDDPVLMSSNYRCQDSAGMVSNKGHLGYCNNLFDLFESLIEDR